MRRMMRDAKNLLNDSGYPGCRPMTTAEAEGRRAACKQFGQAGKLFRRERRVPSWCGLVAQRFDPAVPRTLQPLADSALRHTQFGGDPPLRPAPLV
jgi:hypothetical protein